MVPMSPASVSLIREYLPIRNGLDVKPSGQDIIFLNRRGAPLTRVMVFYIIRDLAAMAGIAKRSAPTLSATLLPPIFSKGEPTCAPYRKCLAMSR